MLTEVWCLLDAEASSKPNDMQKLEAEARKLAEESLRDAAPDKGILFVRYHHSTDISTINYETNDLNTFFNYARFVLFQVPILFCISTKMSLKNYV